MEEATLKAIVIESVAEIQELSGRPVGHLDDDTKPIKGLEGFDSLNSLEAKHLIMDRLNCEFEGGFNPFISLDGNRALSVREVVKRLKEVLK